ncbi:ABC transporter substrate-binding protein [Variovorax sp. Sphag1AA]|uniref:ABC transporter substrate-binding protein n=1 Tax=Variovorax sp. Sphag1AA TaxID=2587027 RepID=UPI00160BD7D2|nr:ABC transporter substrate-binding protein [Variovorax sp. Sphag1AA]MBB3180817.1 peptide/nickel transport system substrate-binding protein [Variovorax sp. Sphag1AA]
MTDHLKNSTLPRLTRRQLTLGALAAAGGLATTRYGRAATGKGTAVLAIDADPPTLNLGTTTDFAAGDVSAKILEGLVWLDPQYNPKPSLATAWTVSPDGKTYRFTLRPGVKWHDGKDFTSADVKFTLMEVIGKLHPRAAPVFKNLGIEVDTPDALTVVVRMQKPYAPLLSQLTVFDAPILPRHLYEGSNIGTNPANQKPVGTGPFKFGEWKRGASIKLVRNDQYWDGDKPFLESIIFQVIPQAANRVPALQTGEIDELLDFYTPKPEVPRILADKNLAPRRGVNIPAVYFLMFNTQSPLFSKLEARHAAAFAIDRQRLVKQAMNGIARPGAGAFGDGFKWLFNDEVSYAKKYPLDAARAKALFEKAGAKPGSTTVRMPFDASRAQMRAQAQIIQDNLRQIGLEVKLEPLERSVYYDRVFAKRDYDMMLGSYFSAGDPAIGYTRLYNTYTGTAPNTNASGYSNPKVDDLLSRAATATDRDVRAKAYKELQVILNEDLPTLVLFDEETVDTASKKLTGVFPALDARDQWAGVKRAD